MNDRIILTIIQSVGLLLPVIFLTFRFYLQGTDGDISEGKLFRRVRLFGVMVLCLTGSGFLATIGLFDTGFKPISITIAVLLLALFFALYGVFIWRIIKWEKVLGA